MAWRDGHYSYDAHRPQEEVDGKSVDWLEAVSNEQLYQTLKGLETAMLSGLEELHTVKREILQPGVATTDSGLFDALGSHVLDKRSGGCVAQASLSGCPGACNQSALTT